MKKLSAPLKDAAFGVRSSWLEISIGEQRGGL